MKKLLSLVLVLCMLFTGCILLASCNSGDGDGTGTTDDGQVNVDDMTGNTAGTIANGTSKSFSNFFDIADIGDTVEKALMNGSTSLKIDGLFAALGLSEEIPALSATLYTKSESQVFKALAYELAAGDMKLTEWVDTTGNAVLGVNKALWGSDQAIKVELPNETNWKNSPIFSSSENLPESYDRIMEIALMYSKLSAEDYEAIFAWRDATIAKLNPVIAEETVNNVEAVTATYTFSNATIADMMKYFAQNYPDALMDIVLKIAEDQMPDANAATVKEMLGTAVDSVIEQMNKIVSFDFKASASVAKDGGALVAATLKGKVEPQGDVQGEADIELTAAFSENAITVSAMVDMTDADAAYKASGTIGLTKTEENGKNIIAIDVDVVYQQGAIEMKLDDLLTGEISYEKSTGKYAVTAAVTTGDIMGGAPISANLNGTASVKDGKAVVTVDEVGYMNFSLKNLGISVTFDSKAEMPAVPTDAQDLWTMTKEQMSNLIQDAQGAPVMELIAKLAELFPSGSEGELDAYLDGTYACMSGLDVEIYSFTEDGSFSYQSIKGIEMGDVVSVTYEISEDSIYFIVGNEFWKVCEFENNGDSILLDGTTFSFSELED